MKLIDKRNTVIKVLVKKRDKYIFASEILQGNEDKITKDDLDDILDYLFNNGAISYKYQIIDGTETNIPLYRLSVDRLLLIEKAKKLNVSLKSLIQQKQSGTPAEEIGDTNKNLQPQPEIKSFSDMFTITDWNKYLDALTECKPKLLKKENDNYTFIGNQKTQRGCIAQWFKYLKAKGIIYQTLNRQEIAKVLSNEIVNFSIVGSSIDNETEFYKTTIHKQLEQYTNNII